MMSILQVLHVSLIILATFTVIPNPSRITCHAWTTTSTRATRTISNTATTNSFFRSTTSRLQHQRRLSVLWAFPSDDKKNEKEEEAVLTDLDARVLQEMLQNDKLDLNKEANMKKLLERGIKRENGDEADKWKPKEEEPSEFSSEIMKTLGNTKLWKALRRNAKDALESLQVAVANRVERDAKLLASLGIFAFDRALKDVQRALPAVSKVVQDRFPQAPLSSRLLSSTSSFQNVTEQQKSKSIRDEMMTPLDELKSVQRDLKEIFTSADTKEVANTEQQSQASNVLRSAAPSNSKFTKERFQKAYQKQKQTKLKREKENIAQSSTRVASNILDSAYQVKRELEVEPNKPGYKTKALREGVAAKANLLAEGATRFLGARRPQEKQNKLEATSSSAEVTAVPEAETVSDTEFVMDVEVEPTRASSTQADTQAAKSASTSTGAAQQEQQLPQPQINTILIDTKKEWQNALQSELLRIATDLEYLIQNPEESWMNADLIADQVDLLQTASLESIVTQMVQAERTIIILAQQDQETTVEAVLDACETANGQLQDLFALVDKELPSTVNILEFLQRRLVYGQDYREEEEGLPIMMKLDILRREWKLFEEEKELEQMKAEFSSKTATDPVFAEKIDDSVVEYFDVKETETVTDDDEILQKHFQEDPVSFREAEVDPVVEAEPVMEIMDVIPEAMVVESDTTPGAGVDHRTNDAPEVIVDEPTMRVVSAEVVSDDDFDFEDTASNAKTVEAVDENAEEAETPLPVKIALRLFDVLFLVVEKGVLAVPTLISATKTISERLDQERLAGQGSEGWDPIESAQRGDKRY